MKKRRNKMKKRRKKITGGGIKGLWGNYKRKHLRKHILVTSVTLVLGAVYYFVLSAELQSTVFFTASFLPLMNVHLA